MTRGPRLGLPSGEGTGDRRALLVAIGLHVALFILVSGAVAFPVLQFLREETVRTRALERVVFVAPSRARPAADSVPRPLTERTAQPAEVAAAAPPVTGPPVVAPPVTPPTEIPVGVAPPRREVAIGDTVDRRTVGRGLLPGLSPGPADPRLLRPGPMAMPNGPNIPERPLQMDSITRSWIQTYWDSLARQQANAHNPLDWTFNRNGTKYGLDPQYIYFGKFKLPTMLLALLPISTLANPTISDRRRALESMRWEIQYQSMRAVNDEAFNEAVKELRARKEREHEAAMKKKAAEKASGKKEQ